VVYSNVSPRLRKNFRNSCQANWDDVLTVAFVFQIQPLNPKFRPSLIFAQPAADGKAGQKHRKLLKLLKMISGDERTTVDGFATDSDVTYDDYHKEQARLNLEFFRKNRSQIPLKRHYWAISDIPHLLKLCDDLSSIVFSDDPITKIHGSLPMVLFRFEILLKLCEAR
jgi:hypothetical protein